MHASSGLMGVKMQLTTLPKSLDRHISTTATSYLCCGNPQG
uniref:Uncharacterized protein n=1 Tax=Pseudomonas fluorescens (strain SBW25) TaxID=216595 RepID=A0A0G4E5B1_PSEFS|nr:hypothetical protein PQBR57_0411 [Pseudomonas fluorescens SBW25]